MLSEIKQKALKTIEIINSKEKQKTISYEDFDKGFFPWERFQKENTNYPKRKYCNIYKTLNEYHHYLFTL